MTETWSVSSKVSLAVGKSLPTMTSWTVLQYHLTRHRDPPLRHQEVPRLVQRLLRQFPLILYSHVLQHPSSQRRGPLKCKFLILRLNNAKLTSVTVVIVWLMFCRSFAAATRSESAAKWLTCYSGCRTINSRTFFHI